MQFNRSKQSLTEDFFENLCFPYCLMWRGKSVGGTRDWLGIEQERTKRTEFQVRRSLRFLCYLL
jgi:hypothetical protein